MATKVPCIHYWIIDSAAGEKSKGHCKKCGEHHEFNNTVNWVEAITKKCREKPVSVPNEISPEVSTISTEKKTEQGKAVDINLETGHSRVQRGIELAPAREKAKELFKEGKNVSEIQAILLSAHGHIPSSTVYGWKSRQRQRVIIAQATVANAVKPITPGAVTGTKDNGKLPEMIALVVNLFPFVTDESEESLKLWKNLFDCTFEYFLWKKKNSCN